MTLFPCHVTLFPRYVTLFPSYVTLFPSYVTLFTSYVTLFPCYVTLFTWQSTGTVRRRGCKGANCTATFSCSSRCFAASICSFNSVPLICSFNPGLNCCKLLPDLRTNLSRCNFEFDHICGPVGRAAVSLLAAVIR